MATTTVSTRGGFGSWTVFVNNKFEGHVKEAKRDGKFSAIRGGKILGRFNSKVEAVDAIATEVL